MFRQTSPGRMEAVANQLFWNTASLDGICAAKGAEGLADGPQFAVQRQMPGHLLQQLRKHSPTDKLHTDALSSPAPPVSDYELYNQLYQLPATIAAGGAAAAAAASNSFSFQTGMPGQPQDTLEALFAKAEAVVEDLINSPQAAMLFGELEALDPLSELCARLPSATRVPCSLSSLPYPAGQTTTPPCTPASGRKRLHHPGPDTMSPDAYHNSNKHTPGSASPPTEHNQDSCRISSDAAGSTPRRRWGLDLSDEGSDYSPDWCKNSGNDSGTPGAMSSPQLKQPRSSQCCINHNTSPTEDFMSPQGSPASAMQAAGTPQSSTARKIRIKIKGAGSPMQGTGATRSSCPGAYLSAGPSRMGCISATAVNMPFPAVLDLSTPPPESPKSPGDFDNNNNYTAAASPAGFSSPSARRRTTGSGGGSSRRLSGHKHGKDGRISDALQQSPPMRTAAASRQSGPGALLTSPSHLASPEGVLHGSDEWPEAGSPAKRRSRLGASCETSSGGADLAAQTAAMSGYNRSKVPAAAEQYPSFTSWANEGIAAAAAAAIRVELAVDGAMKFQSPFSKVEAVDAALLAYEVAPAPHPAVKSPKVKGSRKGRQSTPGGKVATATEQQQQWHDSSSGGYRPEDGIAADPMQRLQEWQAGVSAVASNTVAGAAGTAGYIPDSPMQLHEGGLSGGCSGLYCHNCGCDDSPQWRAGPEGPKTLCNRCGVRYKKSTPAYAAAANPEAVQAAAQAAAQAHALSMAALASVAQAGGAVQQSPFAAASMQYADGGEENRQQVHIPMCAADVGIKITTQSGTGPLARLVSSQAVMLPGGIAYFTNCGNMGTQPGQLACYQNNQTIAAGEATQQQQQQEGVLHLQLPRIRTKSQVLRESAVSDMFGSSSSGGISGVADPPSSSTATPSTEAGSAAAAGYGNGMDSAYGSKPVSPGLLNHISMMNLRCGNMGSPGSAMSSYSWAGMGAFGDAAAAAAVAAGESIGFCNVQQVDKCGPFGVLMSSKQQRQQLVQQQYLLAANNPNSMYAPYCKGRPVTTSMPVIPKTQAAPAMPTAPAAVHEVAYTAAASPTPVVAAVGLSAMNAHAQQQQVMWPSCMDMLQAGFDYAMLAAGDDGNSGVLDNLQASGVNLAEVSGEDMLTG